MPQNRMKPIPQDWDSGKIAEYLLQQQGVGYKYKSTQGTFDGITFTLTIELEPE